MQPHRFVWHLLFLVAVFATPVVAQEKASDWPQFRGPGGHGVSAEVGLPTTWSATENVVWKKALPGRGTSSPVIIGSRIFLTCYRGNATDLELMLVCLNREDGKILWSKEVAAKLPEQAKIREDHGYASNTPVVDSERIYVFFGKTGVFAFDYDGQQIWQADVGSGISGWGSATSPVLSGDHVIVNAGVESESLVALDKKTGKEVWRSGGINESWNTPLLTTTSEGKPELIVAIFGKVLGINPETGDKLWSCATEIPWYMVPSLVAHDGVVYCVGGRNGGGGLAVKCGGRGDVTKSHRIWAARKGTNVPSPILHEGHLYWASDTLSMAYCCEAATGKIVYEERLNRPDQIYASPVLADGKIYYVGRSGRTFVVAAKPTFELLAVNELEPRGMFNASPAVAGKRLFLRSDRFLYCLGKE